MARERDSVPYVRSHDHTAHEMPENENLTVYHKICDVSDILGRIYVVINYTHDIFFFFVA